MAAVKGISKLGTVPLELAGRVDGFMIGVADSLIFEAILDHMRLNGEVVAWVDGLNFVFANQAGQTWATWTESV